MHACCRTYVHAPGLRHTRQPAGEQLARGAHGTAAIGAHHEYMPLARGRLYCLDQLRHVPCGTLRRSRRPIELVAVPQHRRAAGAEREARD
eukprot:353681-Chlamydomonas_euryale.AAC.2